MDPEIKLYRPASPTENPPVSPCARCRNIFIQPDTYEFLTSKKGLQDRRRLFDMVRYASKRCYLCITLLWAELPDGDYNDDSTPAHELGPHDRHFTISVSGNRKVRTANYTVAFRWKTIVREREPGNENTVYLAVYRKRRFKWENIINFQLSTLDDVLISKFGFSRMLNSDVTCDRTYQTIKSWLTTCDSEHPRCQRKLHDNQKLNPTFILDLSLPHQINPQHVRLCHCPKEVQYAALSYCWGSPQPRATTSHNIEAYLTDIDIGTLPQTLQDAVFVTRKLGLRYLWIDSICITQDSQQFMMHEIGRMENIYRNAYVTISASAVPDCRDGFLKHRALPGDSTVVPFRGDDHTLGTICVYETELNRYHESYNIEHEPINERAWTLQEGFMSRRVLIYSKYQLFWACSKQWGKDGGDISRHHYFAWSHPRSVREISARQLRNPTLKDWLEIAQVYSTKKLTNPMDKLPALSAIASYFGHKMVDTYYAGLWSKRLREQLAWSANQSVTLPEKWRAPSWSFLSVDGSISFPDHPCFNFDIIVTSTKLGCTISSCRVDLLSNNAPFGRVLSAELKLYGRVLEVVVRSPVENVHTLCQANTDEVVGHVRFDTVQPATDSKPPFSTTVKTTYGIWNRANRLWFLLLYARHMSSFSQTSKNRGLRRLTTRFEQVSTPKHYCEGYGEGYGKGCGDGCEEVTGGLALARLADGSYHRVGFIRGESTTFDIFAKEQPQLITIV